MDVNAVIIGTGKWQQYTLPLIESMRKHEPKLSIVCVDNGSQYPEYPGVEMVKTPTVLSYSEAINTGLRARQADWHIVMNNDILVRRSFMKRFAALDPLCLYGFTLHRVDCRNDLTYLTGWCWLLSRQVLERVGYFDEAFKPMWFEDADYSLRVKEAGLRIDVLSCAIWGFSHLERNNERQQFKTEQAEAYQHNHDYLAAKHGL